jgi:hypothetical protein
MGQAVCFHVAPRFYVVVSHCIHTVAGMTDQDKPHSVCRRSLSSTSHANSYMSDPQKKEQGAEGNIRTYKGWGWSNRRLEKIT